jgi:hypothetical protein
MRRDRLVRHAAGVPLMAEDFDDCPGINLSAV